MTSTPVGPPGAAPEEANAPPAWVHIGRWVGGWPTLVLLAGFLALVIIWCGALGGVEWALGVPFRAPAAPARSASAQDALWHVGTALLLVAPARSPRLFVVGPAASLGLDIDHLFGGFVPAPFGRMAHNLFFVLGVAAAGLLLRSPFAATALPAAIGTHLAVDGGAFPLFAPLTTATFGLPYPVAGALIVAAAVGFYVAAGHRSLTRRSVAGLAAACLPLLVALPFIPPSAWAAYFSG